MPPPFLDSGSRALCELGRNDGRKYERISDTGHWSEVIRWARNRRTGGTGCCDRYFAIPLLLCALNALVRPQCRHSFGRTTSQIALILIKPAMCFTSLTISAV